MSLQKITHSGNLLLAGFGGMLIMMSVLIYLAVKQDIPMVSKDYYRQELVYQQKLDAMNNTNRYDPDFSVAKDGDRVVIGLPAALSRDITAGTARFYCPAHEEMDREAPLYPDVDGLYPVNVDLQPGMEYVVKISFRSGGKDYYKELTLK